MNEFRSGYQPDSKESARSINSPVEMARVNGFEPVAKNQGRRREYSKEFEGQRAAGLPDMVMILRSEDFHDGELEEIHFGVRLKEGRIKWELEESIFSQAFLDWMVANGGDVKWIDSVKEMKSSTEKGRLQKTKMRENGYDLVAQIIQQAEDLGYFDYLRKSLAVRIEEINAFAEVEIKAAEEAIGAFLKEFPQYTIFGNQLEEERTVYAAKLPIRKGRVQAMKVVFHQSVDKMDEGTIEFQLGSMAIDEQNNLIRFSQIDPPKDADGKYPPRWFQGRLYDEDGGIIKKAVESRKKILGDLKR